MTYELEISIRIRPAGNYGEGLQIQETLKVNANDFLECAKILGAFHDLAHHLDGVKSEK